jgi:hypothetical protein
VYTLFDLCLCLLKDAVCPIQMFTFRYVMTFELPDEGEFGFALPPKYILPTCKETMAGLLSILTPRTAGYKKMYFTPLRDGKEKISLNLALVVCNILFYIILCSE